MRKFFIIFLLLITVSVAGYFIFLYNASFSEGFRSGQMTKFSHKGIIFKTWEGELNIGISGVQTFAFSVSDDEKEVIAQLKELEGTFVKITYTERYKTFPWWGDTKYFVTEVKKIKSPLSN